MYKWISFLSVWLSSFKLSQESLVTNVHMQLIEQSFFKKWNCIIWLIQLQCKPPKVVSDEDEQLEHWL